MKYHFEGCDLRYELELMCCHFFPGEKPVTEDDGKGLIKVERRPSSYAVAISKNGVCAFAECGFESFGERLSQKRAESRAFKTAFYEAASKVTDISVPWGTLTGIRPSKPIEKLLTKYGREETEKILGNEYFTRPEKIRLGIEAAEATLKARAEKRENGVSIYIGIPFCPTRCRYCSFVSQSIASAGALLSPYLDKLCEEIALRGKTVESLSLSPETLYIGGGTPAVLSGEEITRLFKAVDGAFSIDAFREMTFEAGRPDCITEEKLKALAAFGKSIRISVNPQSLSDEVLKEAGRPHTAADYFKALSLVRDAGFENINSDVIAGLKGDTPESFEKTVSGLIEAEVPSITVHALCLKRAAFEKDFGEAAGDAAKMVNIAAEALYAAGYKPYYLYRQRNTAGNLENVGWAKKGGECLYNIYMMEDVETVLACGAGSVSKLHGAGGDRRVPNFKFPHEYLNNPLKDEEVFTSVLS